MNKFYVKHVQVTLPAVQKEKLDLVCGSSLASSAEIRRWIADDLPGITANYLPAPSDARPKKIMLRISKQQWCDLEVRARALHSYPARLIRQIIIQRLAQQPTQQTLLNGGIS